MDTTFTTQSATSTATNASIFNSSTFDSQNSSNMSDFSSYYYGLPGMPQLLARSSKIPRPATIVTDPDDSGFRGPTPMLHFVSKDRVIKQALGKGLRESIVAILMTKKPVTWTSVDYLRLGRNHIELESPAVVLITAEKDHTATAEAQRVVDVIKEECVKVGLPGLEVEMMEGIRSEGPAHRADDDNPGSRTQDFVYGLTKHRAIFGGDRMHVYNPLTEPEVILDQPSEVHASPVLGSSDARELGSVQSSSGIRVSRARPSRRHRVDWALINVDQNNCCPDRSLLVNQGSQCENLLHTSITSYVKTAGKTSYESRPKDVDDVPEYLGNHLSRHDILEKQDMPMKSIRITLCGTSDYLWGDGITKSDEWHIKDAPSGSRFSLKGDSGALVWDIDGAVVGMMWGDCFQTLVTCVTPIEAVLADIKETLGARNFIMVVRNPTRK
ncbi:uncharacterized protein L3040_009001 [Drepanopeziza brunnea f. sp. 'multigermtubi']|uniref:uncharacterized protein n=1 Tax=Drepanopeziza brunnea f. sp. 'multigermtubi' TaxID=698441 RepID=UPI0023A202E4|nr:hypothetical protein L3040_009001 [Drepanopeziza brunnea f. sp. 'multigermtubi']